MCQISDCSGPGTQDWQGLLAFASCPHTTHVQDVLRALGAAADESYAYIASMAVDVPHRRRGVATALLEAAEQRARSWGHQVVTLHVYESNFTALQCYISTGYVELQRDAPWKALLGAKRRVLFYKDLSKSRT